MDLPTKSAVDVLTYLLPGFLTAALVYNLTPAPRPIPFERVVQALIYTVLVQVLTYLVRLALMALGPHLSLGTWGDDVRLTWSVAVAICLGLGIAWAMNTDRVHRVLRKTGMTHQTSFASEWYGALSQNRGYMVLHLVGQRRLYGWAEEWPSTAGKGYFVMAQAEWLDESRRIDLSGVHRILIRAEDVEAVELMSVA